MLDDATKEKVTECGRAMLSIEQTAIICDLPADECRLEFYDRKSEFHLAYRKGQLESIIAVRMRIIEDARNGSGPAQMETFKMFKEFKLSDFDEY